MNVWEFVKFSLFGPDPYLRFLSWGTVSLSALVVGFFVLLVVS